jgi:hypothetical protein
MTAARLRLPPPWVRRADWKWAGGNPAFHFPHLQGDEDAEISQLHRLWDYAESHRNVFTAWMATVDAHRGPELPCMCPQCVAEREGRA